MRVAILGVGGVGRTLAAELRSDPRVTSLLLIDKIGDRARVLAGLTGRVSIEARSLAVDNRATLAQALRGCKVVVNATLPKYNFTAMGAALDAGVNYVDVAATGPLEPGGRWGILAQLDLHDVFRTAGLRALLSMGLDPGMSNVIAKDLASRLDAVDAVRIRSGGVAKLPGFTAFPLYSREAFLEDALLAPTVWSDGKLEERPILGEPEEYEFPAPVGKQTTYLMSHEEVKTIPLRLGKPVQRVDFKYALNPHLVNALQALNGLGLLDETRMVRLGGQQMSFRKALLAAFPEPSALVTPLEGSKVLCVEVEGSTGSERKILRGDILMSHAEANRRRSTTAVYYLTAVAASIGVVLLADGGLPGAGVYTPESLDVARVYEEWEHRGLAIGRSERAAG
ncbi:MAG TPA: saccharopine dehydrogenase C-terminal domain-containing protein [Thermoplasmata archaeon]|nr:saccharopine dehydrogenase C-terminal domain-containing protein [Thermoplasmata archaeon]